MDTHSRSPAAERLYDVFSQYAYAGREFCELCYSAEEWEEITRTPVGLLEVELGRKLLWDTADHWENADVYRHYVPRMLELLGPVSKVEDLYPLHLFETLIAIGFRRWPIEEQDAVIAYLESIGPEIVRRFEENDRTDWTAGIAALKSPILALPAASAEEDTGH
jgi:hypothetical protein